MAVGALELLVTFVSLVLFVLYLLKRKYEYWEVRGVRGPKPGLLVGTSWELMTSKCALGVHLERVYKDWKGEAVVGLYMMLEPGLLVNDLELVKGVLITDFGKFADRGNPNNERIERLSSHLFNLEAKRWRPLRTSLSPTFTSGKLKEMFYLLLECTADLEAHLERRLEGKGLEGVDVEVLELTAKFTTDVIGSCVFGLQMNAIRDEDSPFRKMGRRFFRMTWKSFISFRLRNFCIGVFNVVGPILADREMENFFIDTTMQVIEYRKKNGIVKHDFVDLLMAIRDDPDKVNEIELTDELLTAQLFVFFLAGFETSSTTMSNALYELALNPKVQEKLRREIKEEMERTGGVIEYDGIKNLRYLDMVFKETLRMYPPVNFLTRKALEPYTFRTASGGDLVTVEKGQKIFIPMYAIHRDPQYYPHPEIFDPERFTPEAEKLRNPMTYFPFGDGPRNCVGKRFAVMQTKVGLVKILQNHRFETNEKTSIPYQDNPKAFLLSPKNGINLRVFRDSDCSAATRQ